MLVAQLPQNLSCTITIHILAKNVKHLKAAKFAMQTCDEFSIDVCRSELVAQLPPNLSCTMDIQRLGNNEKHPRAANCHAHIL